MANEQLYDWSNGPIGSGTFLLVAPYARMITQPKTRTRLKKRKREAEALALLLLLQGDFNNG